MSWLLKHRCPFSRVSEEFRKPQPLLQEPQRTHKPKNRTNNTKEFSEQFEGVTGHYPVKQGFWGKSHQKVHPNVRQNLCHTASLWYLFLSPITGLEESTAVHLQFVRQYSPHLYRWTFLASKPWRKGNPTVHLPFVLQYAPHLYGSTPPICMAVLLRKYWGLGSPESSWVFALPWIVLRIWFAITCAPMVVAPLRLLFLCFTGCEPTSGPA